MSEIELERERLYSTISVVSDVIEKEKSSIENLYDNYIGRMEDLSKLVREKKQHLKNLRYSMDNPYFARIDFIFDENGEKKSIYIGKNSIVKDNKIVVVDWRAPISSLYYDSDKGKCSYHVPGEEVDISGTLDLKRQFDIDKGYLNKYFDVDLVTSDKLLQKYLNENNDSRLKSIVSTIQSEQNSVIRDSIGDNLIVQGVAGSGKTTVALHRIAYLVYNYKKSYNPSQFMVIGPNNVFLKYIKNVLPDLDVDGVCETTFEGFAKEYIGEEFSLNSSINKIKNKLSGKDKSDTDKFKCSMDYKNLIDKFIYDYYISLCNKDLEVDGYVLMSKEDIKDIFLNELISNEGCSLDILINKVSFKISRVLEKDIDNISLGYFNYMMDLIHDINNPKEKEIMKKRYDRNSTSIKNNLGSLVKKYFYRPNMTILKLYKSFISNIDKYTDKNVSHLKKSTLNNLKNGSVDFEDLAAIMYIKNLIEPNMEFNKITHSIIDEAQDLGTFNFYILRKIMSNSTFSIFGDLSQGIYDYRGIDSWDEVKDKSFDGKAKIVKFAKSYRTTSEIMEYADDVSEYINLGRSEEVIRHGNAVSISNTDDPITHIIDKVKEYLDKGYKTIAIISKSEEESMLLNDLLRENGLYIPDVSEEDDVNNYKVCTISNRLVKGLEFDAVILNNVNEEEYNSKSVLDMKLLYVAITRALHELDIVYSGSLSNVLTRKRVR